MSGGVDSSLAAALLQQQGYDVEGVTMNLQASKIHCDAMDKSYVSYKAVEDAKKVCDFLRIPHHVFHYQDFFQQTVIDYFVKEYFLARTPNPCIYCNRYLKFGRLFEDVRALGADYLATGHYAKIDFLDGKAVLKKGKDPKKDQSYFLYGISKETLPHILFPLSALEKEQVRLLAKEFQLPVAEKKDSQDICFVPDGKYQDVIARYSLQKSQKGDIKDEKGSVVGQHQGILNYTIGQREGLGIALGRPVYIYRIDVQTNTIYVGSKECLYAKGLIAKKLNLIGMNFSKEIFEANLKIRYNHFDIKGQVHLIDEDALEITFNERQIAVTPGQSVVFYDHDILLGGAVIDRAIY